MIAGGIVSGGLRLSFAHPCPLPRGTVAAVAAAMTIRKRKARRDFLFTQVQSHGPRVFMETDVARRAKGSMIRVAAIHT